MKLPIKQILLENIMDINRLDKKYGNQFSDNILNNIHQQKFGSTLTPEEIEEYRKTSNIVFNLDKSNPTGFIRTKQFTPDDQANIRFFHALNDNLKIQPDRINYISNLASTQKGTGKLLLNKIDHNGNPILLKAWNKDLIPYYKAHGFQQLIHPELRGKLNMYKLNEEPK